MFFLYEFSIQYFSGEHMRFSVGIYKIQFYFRDVKWTAERGCEKVAKKYIRLLSYKI